MRTVLKAPSKGSVPAKGARKRRRTEYDEPRDATQRVRNAKREKREFVCAWRDNAGQQQRKNDLEQQAAERETADASKRSDEKVENETQRKMTGLSVLIRRFAAGWFNSRVYDMLYAACIDGGPEWLYSDDRIQRFQTALFNGGGTQDVSCNTDLLYNMSLLAQVRKKYADEFSPLSRTLTKQCLRDFGNTFMLSQEQRRMSDRKRKKAQRIAFEKSLGGERRLFQVVKIGMSTFCDVDNPFGMLRAFSQYITTIEDTVAYERARAHTRKMNSADCGTLAHVPHCAQPLKDYLRTDFLINGVRHKFIML